VADWRVGGLRVAIEVGQIASGSGDIQQRATALLATLRRLVPFETGRISLLSPDENRQVILASHGSDDPLREYLDTPTAMREVEQLGLNRAIPPMRRRDLPVPPDELLAWSEYLWPAGLREGLVVPLFTPDDRYLGILAVETDTVAHPTDAAKDLIGHFARTIAHAVDPMRTIAQTARIIGDAEAGIVLTRAGGRFPLPGLPTHPVLTEHSDVLTAAAERLSYGRVYSSFLCPYSGKDAAERHVRVTMLACAPQTSYPAVAVILISPAGDLRGLTRRELEIVGLLIDGWSNQRIAAAMNIAERTVATHLEHILVKLGAATRALAAVRALRYGLYVPRPINGIRD
jgi:DNA-binding CsgD family transcriptional regulator